MLSLHPQPCGILRIPDLRASLHLDGAHLLQLSLRDAGQLLGQLTLLPLEILQLIDCDLKGGEMLSAAPAATLWGKRPVLLQDSPWQTQGAAEQNAPTAAPPSPLPCTNTAPLQRQSGVLPRPLPWQTPPRLRSTSSYWPKTFAW